jgi:hypothetical protein
MRETGGIEGAMAPSPSSSALPHLFSKLLPNPLNCPSTVPKTSSRDAQPFISCRMRTRRACDGVHSHACIKASFSLWMVLQEFLDMELEYNAGPSCARSRILFEHATTTTPPRLMQIRRDASPPNLGFSPLNCLDFIIQSANLVS